MKRIFSLMTLAALVTGLVFTSCEKDDDNDKPSNSITIDGTTYSTIDVAHYFPFEDGYTIVAVIFSHEDDPKIAFELALDNSLLGTKVEMQTGDTGWGVAIGNDLNGDGRFDDLIFAENSDLEGCTGWFRVDRKGEGDYAVSFDLTQNGVHATGSVSGKFEEMDID